MPEILLRAYLLLGLVSHKVIWEVLKARSSVASSQKRRSFRVRTIRLVKTAILVGIVVQTLIPFAWMGSLLISKDSTLIRIVGTTIFSLGWVVAVAGRVQLGSNWSDIESPEILQEQQVVARGIYRYIRHPIYVGDLLLLLGLEMALNSWLVLGVVGLVPLVLARAVREERMLKDDLPGYEEYCQRSKRFVPFLV